MRYFFIFNIILFSLISNYAFSKEISAIQIQFDIDASDEYKAQIINKIQSKMDKKYDTLTKVSIVKTENDGTITLDNIYKKFDKYDLVVFPDIRKINSFEYQLTITIFDIKNQHQFIAVTEYFSINDSSSESTKINNIIENLNWVLEGVPFKILTTPENANVYIDDEFIGKTPLKQLSGYEAEYKLKIAKKGYHNYQDKINLKRKHDNIYHYVLQRKNYIKDKHRFNFKYAYTLINDSYTKVDPYVPVLLSYEYFMNDFSIEFETGIINLEREVTINSSPKIIDRKTITIVPLSLAFKYHFFQDYQFSPYLGAGGGIAFVSVSQTEKSQINPWGFLMLGANFGIIELSKGESRINFFIEGRLFYGGDIKVGQGQFNVFGAKTNDDTEITISGFQFFAGISYLFF